MAKGGKLLMGPMDTQPGAQGGLGYDNVPARPPVSVKDPLGIAKK